MRRLSGRQVPRRRAVLVRLRPAVLRIQDGRIDQVIARVRRPGLGDVLARRPTRRRCCPASSTPTCTSTSPAAPSGRASSRRPGPPPSAASPRSSTCRSTRSRRPRPWRPWRSSARGRRRASCTCDVGFWGGAVPDNLGTPRAAVGRRGPRVQVLPAPTRACPSSRRSTRRSSPRDGRGRRVRRAADRARRGPGALERGAAPGRAGRTPTSCCVAAGRGGDRRPSRGCIDGVREHGTRTHVLHLSSARALDLIADATRRGTAR